jgi:PBP1b-binding outer membrane lipoprotein LpoB
MKKLSLFLLIISCVFLTGCSSQSSSTTEQNANDTQPNAEKKSGDTTKTGKVTKVGEKFYLEEASGSKIEIDSYAYDLEAYTGQTLTITGQYSGDTLFVGKIE